MKLNANTSKKGPEPQNDIVSQNIADRKRLRKQFFREMFLFALFIVFIMGSAVVVYYVVNGFKLGDYFVLFHVLWYPLAFACIFLWYKLVRKKKFRDLLLHKPKFPKKHHRWFYIVYSIFFLLIIVFWLMLLEKGNQYAYIRKDNVYIWLTFLHACIGAPIVEEIIFRGYVLNRAMDVWKNEGWYLTWNKKIYVATAGEERANIKEIPIMNFQISYAALIMAIFFGIWHINPIKMIYTPIGGLFFAKTRREWGDSLIPPMMLHTTWNFLANIFLWTAFPILSVFLGNLLTYLS
ncbi:MAG: lysostaphin resistance A-like protein [Promethearchaeota archaeon]